VGLGHKSHTTNVSQAHMADILQRQWQQQLWPQDRMWVNLTPPQKSAKSGQHPQLC